MKRFAQAMFAGGIVAILVAGTAFAGGWATTEFDEALPEFTEGGSWLIGFTVLQHGNHPVAVEGAGLRFTNDNSDAVVFFEAEPVGMEGHYVASVGRLPVGTWTLEVEQGLLITENADAASARLHFAPYPVGEITVGTAIATGVKTPASKTPAPKTPAPKTPAPKTPAPKTPSTSLAAAAPAAAVEGDESAGMLVPVAVGLAALGVGAIGVVVRHRGSRSLSDGAEYSLGTSEEVG